METFINLQNSTIMTGTTSTSQFLVTEINEKKIGIPLFTFSISHPSIDFVEMYDADLELKDVSFSNTATSYGAGIALVINSSAYAWPIYRLSQNVDVEQSIKFDHATIVAQLTSTGTFVAVKIDNVGYGIPLYNYSTEFPFVSTSPMSAININTNIVRPVKDVGFDNPSTNLNSKIRTYSALINRIKYQLGYPYVNIEVCEDVQIVDFIDKALEWYTKYAGYTEEYLVFHSRLYTEPGLRIDKLFSITPTMRKTVVSSPSASNNTLSNGVSASYDYDLGDYRKVIGVFGFEQGETTGINTLFTLEQAMAQQTYFSYMLGNVGFDLITWEVLKQWLELREKVLAQVPYIDFDNRNQILRIIPPPNAGSGYFGVVGAWVEKPIKDLIMERWVEHYALAISKIAIGNIRGKFQNVTLLGGGTINYNDLLSQGLEEKKALEEELMNNYGEVTPARFWIG